MDPNHKKGKGHGSSHKSSRPPEPGFKGSRNVHVSNKPKSKAVERTERPILFQLGSIASYGVSIDGPKKDPEKIDGKKILKPSSSASSSTPSDSEDMIEISANDANNKPDQPLFNVSSGSCKPQVFVVTHAVSSPTQSPTVQVMDRGGHDHQRIPSSVFSRTGALDWSETSNESLFSLNNIGTNSLTRDQALQYQSSEHLKSGELISLPLQAEDSVRRICDMEEKKSGDTEVTTPEIGSEEKSSTPKVSWTTPSNSCMSNQTPTSMQSLSLPVTKKSKKKKKKQKKTQPKKKKKRCCGWTWLRSCFHCNDNCCTNPQPCCSCCRWPKCGCHYPSCHSCCSWFFCRHWSCCSSSSAEVTDDEMRSEYKEQKLQTTEQSQSKSSLHHRWFCRFPPCLLCCCCGSCGSCCC